jgi:hypothetical protein
MLPVATDGVWCWPPLWRLPWKLVVQILAAGSRTEMEEAVSWNCQLHRRLREETYWIVFSFLPNNLPRYSVLEPMEVNVLYLLKITPHDLASKVV